MIPNELKFYTKFVETNEIYNFVVDNFFIWDNLIF